MKKLFVLAALAAFSAPLFAADAKWTPDAKHGHKGAKMEMKKDGDWGMTKAERKATEEKLEKLVKEYKAAKAGSQKQTTAKANIVAVVTEMHDKKIAKQTEQLSYMEKKVDMMRENLATEKTPEAKKAWVDMMTDKVIAEDGDLDEVWEGMKKDMPHGKGPMHGPDADMPPAK